jgi:hypothetical protein
MSLLYEPPPGYYDEPFSWVFDGSQLTDGANALNNAVPIYAGYGDFILRRIVGLENVLQTGFGGGAAGQFQIRDASGNYMQSVPQSIGRFLGVLDRSDIAMSRDVFYPESSSIVFDLYTVRRTVNFGQTFGAQIAFQGVRRVQGVPNWGSSFRYTHRTYTYNVTQNLPVAGPVYYPQSIYLPILDYDFELYKINIAYSANAFYNLVEANPLASMAFYSQQQGTSGAGTQVVLQKTTVPNQLLAITTAGNVVTLTGATDAFGNTTTTGYDIQQAINSNIAASLIVYVTPPINPAGGYNAGTYTLTGGGITSINPSSLIQLYDQNGIVCQYIPMLDQYMNASDTVYGNGALVPPLLYRQNSRLRIDVTNYNSSNPSTILIDYTGRQRIPC